MIKLAKTAALLLALVSAGASAFQAAQPPRTFTEAKKIAWDLYADHQQTFYCGCNYTGNRVDLQSCGYQVRKNANRASRVEWEHVVPAWVIGHQRQCWQNGGRENCSENDPVFAAAEADLHNLVPAIGEVNGDRSNFALGMVTGKPIQYGACEMVVDFKADTAMPPERVRGAAARIYLYMADRYKLRLSKLDQRTYEAWNRQYPVSDWEKWRNQATACVMGWGNKFVGPVDMAACPGTSKPMKATRPAGAAPATSSPAYSCSTRKTCGQMASCAEAKHQLTQCGNSQLDRNNDGVPCESLCK